jgi:hypothetical protein
VGMKSEDATYYGVPLFYYINLARMWLLLLITIWEAWVVGEGSQSVWATCLIQCLLVSYLGFFSRPYIQTPLKRIFKGLIKSLELGQLLKDLLIRSKRSQRKIGPIQRPLWQCKKLWWTSSWRRIWLPWQCCMLIFN